MLLVVVGSVAAFVTTVLLRLIDLAVEGTGARARRSIRADVDLLVALPKDLREKPGGRALADRIEASLLRFGGVAADTAGGSDPGAGGAFSDSASPGRHPSGVEARRRARFNREVAERWTSGSLVPSLIVAFVAFIAIAVVGGRGSDPGAWVTIGVFVASGGAGMAAGFIVFLVARRVIVQRTARRWREDGEQLPDLEVLRRALVDATSILSLFRRRP